MNDIKLNFVNNSNDKNNSKIVIFQKNADTSYDELAVAWLVIENCGSGWNHPFVYEMNLSAAALDSWNNYSPIVQVENGIEYAVKRDASGDVLQPTGDRAAAVNEIDILNKLPVGSIDVGCYRSGKLLALKTGIAPEQKAIFQFKPKIWIGVASQVVEGTVMNSAVLSQMYTELDLMSLKSADIVMTGGGSGKDATAFQFTLMNKVTY